MFLLGRVMIAALFFGGAVQKLVNPGPAQALLALAGLPVALVWPAALFDLVAAVGLLRGPRVDRWALALAAYCVATSFFHLLIFDAWQATIFVKNWAIAGGLLAVAELARVRGEQAGRRDVPTADNQGR